MLLSPLYGIPVFLFAVFVLGTIIMASVKVLREYERAVAVTLGRFPKVKGPGLVLELLDKAGKAPGVNGATHIPLIKEVPLSA